MKLYTFPDPAPNPRRVRLFCAEKDIEVESVMLDLMKGEHKSADLLARNSLGQLPVLTLDDGKTHIAETVSICRYLEGLHPDKGPRLFGSTPLEQAQVDMWIRRAEFQVGQPIANFWRHAHPFTARVVEQHKAFGESNRAALVKAVAWLDKEMSDGREWLAGAFFSMADIAAVTNIDFATYIGMAPLGDEGSGPQHVRAWHARVNARPAFVAKPNVTPSL
ncbi:hypothetical protein GGTG_02402 [Gaeumannomyces tritici R3-111a-1]|uniref:glutathione transferase n=1 Tax=Gaeumannomyces tritici (strain R3-111a-1) TaxID=644352 RepID=J3NM98_GAET3|nr:hypothetical protein GGTG_02402 [Gaeumannomyces tritici R3-111a-1]EJT82429.1 hypothetical protein GGTG_02402 [Gaeumannomyces tritici R3-111a-1]